MKLIDNELIAATDIDDTLVMWDNPTVDGPGKVAIEFAGRTVYLTPHQYHIDLIKMYKERGYFVIAWSANGRLHVKRVIDALGLNDYVDQGMTKLTKHVDDSTDAAGILGPRVYCADMTKPIQPSDLRTVITTNPPKILPEAPFTVYIDGMPMGHMGILNGR